MKSKLKTNGLLMVFLLLAAVYATRPIEAFDTFWQLQSGKYIWQTGSFIYQDIFSLAYDVGRLEHCWLHDIVLYIFYVVGGYPLLSLFKPLSIFLCMALLSLWANKQHIGHPSLLAGLLLCLIASEPSWLVRPQLWTFIFSTLFIYLLLSGRESGWRAWGWMIPVMLLWANVHAGCIFGFVLIGLFWSGEFIRLLQGKGSLRALASLALCGALTFGVAFINPYGYRIPLSQLLAHLKQHQVMSGEAPVGMLGNMEWLPSTFEQVPFFYVIMILWGLLIIWRLRRLDPAEGIFFLAFLYMGVSQIRHTTLVAILSGFFLPGALSELFGYIEERWQGVRKVFQRSGYVLVLILALLVISKTAEGDLGWGLKKYEYPEAAADFVLDQKLPTQLYNSYDWGGYLMWRLYPQHLVFVDGRSGSTEHFTAASRIDAAEPGWEQTLLNYGVNTIVTRTCFYDTGEPLNLVFALSQSNQWQLVYADDVALVYKRKGTGSQLPSIDGRLAFETMYKEAQRLLEDDGSREKAHLSMALAALMLGRQQEAKEIYAAHIRGTSLQPLFDGYVGISR